MYVRLLSGRYAGEVQDVRADCAKQMIADGRAEQPSFVAGEIVSASDPDVTSTAEKVLRKSGSRSRRS